MKTSNVSEEVKINTTKEAGNTTMEITEKNVDINLPPAINKYVAAIAGAIYANDKSPDKLKDAYNYFLEEFSK